MTQKPTIAAPEAGAVQVEQLRAWLERDNFSFPFGPNEMRQAIKQALLQSRGEGSPSKE